ncbi:MAG TPA: DNA repair protein RecO [Trueperaceae bacterium]
MSKRYQVTEGIVIRRTELPSGDIIATLLSREGKWRGVARKGKLLGGNLGRLSLFHDVTVQYYRKSDENLALMTQIQLNGALARLTEPTVYPYAHVLAELADHLTVDVHLGENFYEYLTSALRGLAHHTDPEAVTLAYGWKLLQQAGLSPRLQGCAHCGAIETINRFDVAAGGLSCANCRSGFLLSETALRELIVMVSGTVRSALALPLEARAEHWAVFSRYLAYHVGDMHAPSQLRRMLTAEEARAS